MRAMPTAEMPRPLERVTEAAREREHELGEAEANAEAAEQAVEAARQRDIEEIAAAREIGRADPRQQHEEEALLALAAAQRERDICAVRSRTANAHVEELLAEHADAWRGRVEKEWAKADQGLKRKLAEIEAALGHRVELAATWSWLRAVERGEDDERVLRKSSGLAARLPDVQALAEAIDLGRFDSFSTRVEEAERQKREVEEADRAEFAERLAEARAAQEREG